jgi:AraC family transcriptional regulator
MNQPPLSASRFAELLPAPPTVSTAWSAFSLTVSEPPLHVTAAFADHLLAAQISGRCRLRQEVRGRSVEGWTGPGAVSLAPAHVQGTWDATGPSRVIHLYVPHAFLSRVIAEDWGVEPANVEIVGQFLVRDPVIEGVLTRMALEARNGSPSGPLYAESASEFLARHIIHSYSSLSKPPPRPAGGLPARRLKIVLDYIEENLGQPIALHWLAELAGVSTRHFERAFRQVLGVPPHAYVLGKRVTAARDLLLSQPTLAIEEIATRVGLSSSSHLASAFRRQTGYSPTAFRRLASHNP